MGHLLIILVRKDWARLVCGTFNNNTSQKRLSKTSLCGNLMIILVRKDWARLVCVDTSRPKSLGTETDFSPDVYIFQQE